jgi:hypothetical protein
MSQLGFAFVEILPPSRFQDFKIEKEVYEEYGSKLNETPELVSQENLGRAMLVNQNIYNKRQNEFEKTFDEFRMLNPINLIHECRSCRGIMRSKDNKARAEFENAITEEITKQDMHKKEAVNYLSFASGGLFQDLMVLIKACKQGIREINLHCVDMSYSSYIAAVEHMFGNQIEAFAAFPTIEQLRTREMTDALLQKFMEVEESTAKLQIRHEMVSQLALWINQFYPDVKCRIFLHRNAVEYRKYIKAQPGMVADVIAATDLGESQREIDAAMNDLQSLVQTVAWHNPGVTTLFMDTKGKIFANPDQWANVYAQASAFISNTKAKASSLITTTKGKALVGAAVMFAGYYAIKKLRTIVE